MPSAFDTDFNDINSTEIVRPLWTLRELGDNEKMLAWQNNAYTAEVNKASKYRELCIKHLSLYKGRFYDDQGAGGKSHFAEASQAGLAVTSQRVSKLVVNHLYALVSQRVSRATRNKPDVAIEPANGEYGDKVSARLTKFWIDYLFYANKFDAALAELKRATCIFGEAYIGVFWDPNAGEPMSEWEGEESQARKEARPPRIAARNAAGEPVMGDTGEPLYIEKVVRTGDVVFKVLTPLNTLVQATGTFKGADYMFYEDYVDSEELKALYPEVADKISDDGAEDGLAKWRTVTGASSGPIAGKVLVRYFYHRPTDFLASGRFVMSTRGAILENKPLPKNQDGLPIVRLTDIDIPNEQRGQSFFIQGKGLNASINDLSSMIRRNAILLSHPRWVVPRGSVVKREALGNDISQIEYAGPTPPSVVAPPPMSQEINAIRQNLRDDLYAVMGVSDIEMGQMPANARSALQLQAADEQADQRSNNDISKYNAVIEGVVEKAINLASAYYEKGDQRLIPVVGRDNQYLLKEFDPSHLTKNYDVRVTNNGSGLKSAKTEMLIQLKQLDQDPANPMIPNNQFMEMLELGKPEQFYDAATVAVKSAEAENESILNQEDVAEPATFEDHITHWNIHMREVQNRGFKVATPPEVQAAMLTHIQATEYLMLLTARKNPAFSIKLAQLQQFPAFFELSMPDRMLLDRARSGNPLTLMEISMIYDQGMPPQPGMGGAAPPPPGGIGGPPPGPPGMPPPPEGQPTGGAQGAVNRNAPLYNDIAPGQPVPPQPAGPPQNGPPGQGM